MRVREGRKRGERGENERIERKRGERERRERETEREGEEREETKKSAIYTKSGHKGLHVYSILISQRLGIFPSFGPYFTEFEHQNLCGWAIKKGEEIIFLMRLVS